MIDRIPRRTLIRAGAGLVLRRYCGCYAIGVDDDARDVVRFQVVAYCSNHIRLMEMARDRAAAVVAIPEGLV